MGQISFYRYAIALRFKCSYLSVKKLLSSTSVIIVSSVAIVRSYEFSPSSFNFVNAASLRPHDGAFVGLSNFPSFDRNHAGEELTKLRFGFF